MLLLSCTPKLKGLCVAHAAILASSFMEINVMDFVQFCLQSDKQAKTNKQTDTNNPHQKHNFPGKGKNCNNLHFKAPFA